MDDDPQKVQGLSSTGFVFLSHNSRDKGEVETLAHALLDAGVRPWLDKWDLIPGRPWQSEIETALRGAEAIIVCWGAEGLGPVQGPEMQVALDGAFRDASRLVIPVLLPGAPEQVELPDFLSLRTWVDLRQGITDARLRPLLAALDGRAAGPAPAAEDAPSPYPGLTFFDEADAPRFFGRGEDVEELLERLRQGGRLLTLLGVSGAGKSSLLLAGLLPAVRGGQLDGRYDWQILKLRPGARPVHKLAVHLTQWMGGDSDRLDALKARMLARPSALSDEVDLHLAGCDPAPQLLLAVDQFEELFTEVQDDAERAPWWRICCMPRGWPTGG